MAYTAAALSFMLAGFKKPIVLTGARQHAIVRFFALTFGDHSLLGHVAQPGSQLPLLLPRSDARQVRSHVAAKAWHSLQN